MTAVAAAGLSTTVSSSVADTDTIMEVDFSGFGTPSINDAPQGEDEVVFNVHGYTGSSVSVSQTRELQDTMRSLGYTETTTAVTWDDSGLPGSAESSARSTGSEFASWLGDYKNANPDTNIRILGHSMGGIVTMETIAAINGSFVIENADFIGSYEVSDAPCEGNGYFSAIESSCDHMGNYYSTNDSIARLGSGPASCGGSSWWGGGGGSTPSNYHDVDVSSSVGSHTSYKSSTGCVQAIIDGYADIADGDGGSDDGSTDGDSCTWWC